MGLFSGIMSKIFGHTPAAAATVPAKVAAVASTAVPAMAASASAAASTATTATLSPPVAPPPPVVDVTAVLDDLAAHHGEKLDWRHSIVDLMKLVGMDSSLASRKELAHDLAYTGDTADSAKMNVWLHREVIRKLAENGGKVPQDLL